MFGVFLSIALGIALFLIVTRVEGTGDRRQTNRLLGIIMAAYGIRLILQTFLRDIPFFSHGVGGDNEYYEAMARTVVLIWEHSGFGYISQNEFPELGETSLPANVFGFVFWLNGGTTRLGCTAVVAFVACLTCFNLYRLARQFGADPSFSTVVLTITLFGPAFLMYTSELYKDGLVAFFVVGAVASGFRLSRKLSLLHVVLGVLSLIPLWYVRFYLVFVAVAPLVVGLAGLNARSIARPLLATLLLLAVAMFLASYTQAFELASDRFSGTLETGTSRAFIEANAAHGSGVSFDDGGNPFGALPQKLVYTILSPFPWQPGSIGFQIGKLDAFLWYFIIYRAIKSARHLFRTDRQLLLMFLVFILPTTFMYALSMANIGLIVRQRLPIVLVAGALAALSKRREAEATDDEANEVNEADEGESSAIRALEEG